LFSLTKQPILIKTWSILNGSIEAANEDFIGGNLLLLNAGGSEEQFVV
jgi:hypothetical protein